MKKLLLSAVAVSAIALSGYGQAVARVLAPASISGNKTFTWADGWGQTPDFNTPGVFVQDTLAFVEDGSTGTNPQGNPVSQEGCNPLINAAQVQGKIAVCYRNTCEFGTKALNAENAGAVAVIIINRDPEAIAMGAGSQGPNVTIPVVMLTSTDGASIKAEINNMVPVVMFLGNKAGIFANDISTNSEVARIADFATYSSTYQSINFRPAIELYNLGSDDQPEVKVKATIVGPGMTTVYADSAIFPMISDETVYIQDGNPNSFDNFSLSNPVPGVYTLTYVITLGANTDEDPIDNVITSSFRVTSNNISLATTAANGDPVVNSYPSNSGGIYTMCTKLRLPTTFPLNHGVTGYKFVPEADTSVANMAGSEILFKVFEWTDTSVLDNTVLSEIASVPYYLVDNNDTRQVKSVSLGTEAIALTGGVNYLVCLETADGVNIAFGYDNTLDYSGNTAINGIATSPIQVNQVTSGVDTWFTGGWAGVSANGLVLNMSSVSGIEEDNIISAQAFPNPAKDQVKVRLNAAGTAQIVVTDITGKVVMNTESNINAQLIDLNTSTFEAGMYVVNITTQDGKTAQVNIVVE